MPATTTNPLVEEYVARCSALLWDLSPALQDQLREDIRQIVGEVSMELEGRPDDLVGPPLRFVSELRVAAGLPEIPAAERPTAPPPAQQDSAWLILASAFFQLLRSARAAAWPWTKQLLVDLRPAWWVARGVGLAFILGSATTQHRQLVLPDLFGSQFLGLISTAAFVVASVHFGRRGPRNFGERIMWLIASIAAILSLTAVVDDLRYPNFFAYDEPGVAYAQEVFQADPEAMMEVSPSTTMIFPKSSDGLVSFVDPTTGEVMETVDPSGAMSVAEDILFRRGLDAVVIEFEGHQHHVPRGEVLSLLDSLFP